MSRPNHTWRPTDEQSSHWPEISGNTVNGVGETASRRPSPVYWQPPDLIPHGQLQIWYTSTPRNTDDIVLEARTQLNETNERPPAPIAPVHVERSARDWTGEIKRVAHAHGADVVGITTMRADWVFDGFEVPSQKWIVVFGVAMAYDDMITAPSSAALAEILLQYARASRVAKGVADWIRGEGHDAKAHCGPSSGSFVLIPPAIEAGLGELGKHGSLVNRELGANFRLGCVLTDVPLIPDHPEVFGVDDFCHRCRVCEDACPPGALLPTKQLIRGDERWYVDFDKCLPYFHENKSCAICLAVCPWSTPGVADTLAEKFAKRSRR